MKKLKIVVVLVVLMMLSGCISDILSYSIVGTWNGNFQGNDVVVTVTSSTSGTLKFVKSNEIYSLTVHKVGGKEYDLEYGFDSIIGWQQRTIDCIMISSSTMYAEVYNQKGTKLCTSNFTKQ